MLQQLFQSGGKASLQPDIHSSFPLRSHRAGSGGQGTAPTPATPRGHPASHRGPLGPPPAAASRGRWWPRRCRSPCPPAMPGPRAGCRQAGWRSGHSGLPGQGRDREVEGIERGKHPLAMLPLGHTQKIPSLGSTSTLMVRPSQPKCSPSISHRQLWAWMCTHESSIPTEPPLTPQSPPCPHDPHRLPVLQPEAGRQRPPGQDDARQPQGLPCQHTDHGGCQSYCWGWERERGTGKVILIGDKLARNTGEN